MRCEEFYAKWERCGNFCEKHPKTAEEIDTYLSFIEQLNEEEKRAFSPIPATTLRPLINEKDAEIKQKAIKKISEDVIGKQHAGRGHKKQVTEKDIGGIIKKIKVEKEKEELGKLKKKEKGKDDLDYFTIFGKTEYQNAAPRLYNVWNFKQRDPRLGESYPGNIPGQIVMNVLYYYTQQGDLVVDPMAGGGSTIDACGIMDRKCIAYDIAPIKNRKEIIKHDIKQGYPKECKNCASIFLDPPYWKLQREGYTRESISMASFEDWCAFMQELAENTYKTIKKGGSVALIIEGFFDEKITDSFLDLPYLCIGYFKAAGFEEMQRISVPMPSEVKSVHDVEYAKKKKIMLDLNRDLIIFRR